MITKANQNSTKGVRHQEYDKSGLTLIENDNRNVNKTAKHRNQEIIRGNGCNADYTTNECSLLGFNKANLLCSSCDQLKKFQLTSLREHCMNCCQIDEEKSIKVYAKARLEVCTCKFGAYPQIQAFIKSDRPNKYPNLTIRYVRGLDPLIKLMDSSGNVQEVLAIERWDTDTVDEFLSTHLERIEDDYRSNLV